MYELFKSILDFIPASIKKAFSYFGLGIITLSGYDIILSNAETQIFDYLQQSSHYAFLEWVGFVDFINLVISALTFRVTFKNTKMFGFIDK